ncbi:alpha/beta fold hydrolase [Luteimicrobium sp. DT211]|uniref:alpha/beta fold hydrolase n=1 Tax=Luteimicrobium sp. DT211 TaxID=3393412 RepID=UPI003CF29915
MTAPARRLPPAAATTAPATLPPAGLPGLDPSWSRLVAVPAGPDDSVPGTRTWHVLDNAPGLASRGTEPRGTILAVHGNPTWSYLWRRLLAPAADAGWRVVAVDQLDMGWSERTGVARTLPQRVRDLGRLTDALGLDGPVVTLGHDWGGVVSLGWAVDHPDRLAGVALLNTAIHQPDDAPVPAPLRLALASGVLGGGTVSTPAFLETTLALGHPALPRDVKDAYRAPYRTAERRGGIGAFVADIPLDPAHPSYAELQRIADGVSELGAAGAPALLQWGPRDPVFRDRYLDDLVRRMPGAQVHRYEGAGHLVAEDADYVTPLLSWLELFAVRAGAAETEGDAASSIRAPRSSERSRQTRHDAASPSAPTAAVASPSDDGAATASASPSADATRTPLWGQLQARRHDPSVALAEMTAGAGGRPRAVSWRLLSRRVEEIAAGLDAFGVRAGDRVSLLVPPSADLTAVLYACVRLGAVVVVADAGLGVAGLTRAVRGAQADVVVGAVPGLVAARVLGWPGRRVSVTDLAPAAARALRVEASLADLAATGRRQLDDGGALPPEPPGDAEAAVLFTSGSTGPAKGVVYTHAQLEAVVRTLGRRYDVGPGTGLVAGFAPFALLGPALGARSVTPDMDVSAPRTLTARAVAAAAAEVDATVVFLSPAALANVVATQDALTAADREALDRVRLFLSAGAPVAPALLAAAQELMPNASAHTPYGMTEGLLMTDVTLEQIAGEAPGSSAAGPGGVLVGEPVDSVTVRVAPLGVDGAATGEPVDVRGVTGEVVVSAPHLKDHYDRLWLTDRAAVRGTDADTPAARGAARRWHRTGDVGHLDDAGRLWIEGRLSHVVVTADGVITPVGPEQRVDALDGVRRSGVVGVGPRGTQQLVVVVEPEAPAAGVRRGPLARARLADADLAGRVRAAVGLPVAAVLVVPVLPTDIRHNSKVDRGALSAWAERVLAGGRMVAP